MDDWQKDWWQQLEKTTVSIEKFFQDINEAVESFTEEVTDAFEELGEHLQDTLVTELDTFVDDFIDFVSETRVEFESSLWEDLENLVDDSDFVDVSLETPSEDNHAACLGCRHYHGQAYNGQILVCAMHPYGVEDNYCPDWEA